MAITAPEMREEIKRRYLEAEDIESRYPDGLTEDANHEDYAQVKKLLSEVDDMEMRLPGLEDAERRHARIAEGTKRFAQPANNANVTQYMDGLRQARSISPGMQFTNSSEYKSMLLQGAFNSNLKRTEFNVDMKEGTSLVGWQLEQKLLLRGGSSTSGQGFVLEDHQPGYVQLLQRAITFIDIVPRLTTSSDTIEYVSETTFTNAAAFTAEATASSGTTGSKPESALAYQTNTSTVKTMAHYIPITNRLLSDAPAIRGIVDGRLLLGLTLVLETQMISGDGTGENFTGLLNAGIQNQGLSGNSLESIYRGRTKVRVTGHANPSVVVMHPNDLQTIRLLREGTSTGQYLMGPPSQVGASTVWGMPVVESEAVSSGTALVMDPMNGFALFDREQAAVRVGYINDQFIRNMQTILAELRAAFVVWRGAAICAVTGI